MARPSENLKALPTFTDEALPPLAGRHYLCVMFEGK